MIQNVTINGVDVFAVLGMFVKSKSVPLPAPKTVYVDVPGSDGDLDLSTALTGGDIKFHDREIRVTFTTPADYILARSEITKLLHGREAKIVFSDDPTHYFKGRAWIDSWGYDQAGVSEFSIVAKVRPYRYLETPTHLVKTVTAAAPVDIHNSRMWAFATFTSSATVDMTEIATGTMFRLEAGVPRTIRELVLREGITKVSFSAAATVSIDYQEGDL